MTQQTTPSIASRQSDLRADAHRGLDHAVDQTAQTARALEIRTIDVHKSFGSNQVLKGINLEIRRGDMVAIVGGSGSGKTVLLRHLIGHFHPDQGQVFVADHETQGAPLVDLATLDSAGMDRLRRHWAVVFQGNALFPGDVFDNIALALREVKGLDEESIRRRARDSVESVGLDPAKVMHTNRDQLSGGMAKRVGIARALALDPLLIFYDEPTSGLDPNMSGQIHDLIRTAHQRKTESGGDRTTIIITHDKDLLYRLQPRIVMLNEGRILFDGTYEAFAHSDAPAIQPYFAVMGQLHDRTKSAH